MVRFGVPGQNVNSLAYVDSRLSTVPVISAPRRPLVTDKRLPMWCEWRTDKNSQSPVEEGEFYKLIRFESNGDATWIRILTSTTPPIISVTGDEGGAVIADVAGNINFQGNVVATLANSKPVFFDGNIGSFLQDCDVQLSGLVAPTPVNTDGVGLASFNNTQFTKDATSGMISIIGNTFEWVEETTDTRALNVNQGVIGNFGTMITMTLPGIALLGEKMCFIQKGAGTIRIAQNDGQTIHTNVADTTTGTTGRIDTIDQWTSFCLICVTEDTDFSLERESHGPLSIT